MLVELFTESLDQALTAPLLSAFDRYVARQATRRWTIFSDYVIRQRDRLNDTLAFSIIPAGQHFFPLNKLVTATARHDFKNTRVVSQAMLDLMVDPRIFTLCFVTPRSGIMPRASILGSLDRNIAMLEAMHDAVQHQAIIKRFRKLRRSAEATSFNAPLLNNIIMASALAGWTAYMLCARTRADRVDWFSDRDNITTAHDRIANDLYAMNLTALCQRLGGWGGPDIKGVNDFSNATAGKALRCDSYLRIPDHFAGVIAAWDLEKNTLATDHPKYIQVMLNAIADRENVQIFRIYAEIDADMLRLPVGHVQISRVTPGASQP